MKGRADAMPMEVGERAHRFGDATLLVSDLDAETLDRALSVLRERRGGLLAVDRAERVLALTSASTRLADRSSPVHREAVTLTAEATGFSEPMVSEALERCFSMITREAMGAVLRSEIASPALVGIVSAGNLPGVAIAKVVLALAAGSAVFVKLATGEPVVVPMFARLLSEMEPSVGEALAAAWWKGGDARLDRTLAKGVDSLIVYGTDETVSSFAAHEPASLTGYGHRVSVGLVRGRLFNGEALADAVAVDVAMHDQVGCLSLQRLFVIGSSEETLAVAAAVARSLEALGSTLPLGKVPEPAALAIRRLADDAEWRALGGEATEVLGDAASGLVILDSRAEFQPGPGYRTLFVARLRTPEDFARALTPARGRLECVGIAPDGGDELTRVAREAGAARVVPIGSMQRPGLDWKQGGRSPLAGIDSEELG